jgi:hypothetical protein
VQLALDLEQRRGGIDVDAYPLARRVQALDLV